MSAAVSLVIPAKNAAGVLRACLGAVVPLLGQDGLDEIIDKLALSLEQVMARV